MTSRLRARHLTITSWLCLTLLLSGTAATAHAADALKADAETAEAGAADDGESARDIVVRAATRTEEARKRLDALPGAGAVIDNTQLEKAPVSNLADVLAFQPGVYAKNDSGSDAIKISIRGSGVVGASQGYRRGIYVTFDGLPLTGPGATPVDLIEPFGIERTEVQIGANAFDVGAAQLGGSIDLVSLTGSTAPQLTLRAEGGSYGYVKGQLATGGKTSFGDYYISVTGGRRSGYQPNSEQTSLGLQANTSIHLSDTVTTSFYLRTRYRNSEAPGLITLNQYQTNPRTGIQLNIDNNSRSVALPFWIGNKTTIKTSARSDLTVGLVFYYHPWQGYSGLNVSNQPVYNDISGTLRYRRTDTLFGRDSVTTIGFTSLNSTNVVVTNTKPIATGVVFYQNAFGGNNQTAYLNNDSEPLPGVHLLLGGALLRSNGYGAITFPEASPVLKPTYWNFAPRVGFRVDVSPAVQLFGNASRSVEAPPSFAYPSAGTETFRSGPASGRVKTLIALRPQIADTYEIGTRGRLPFGNWSLSLYRADIRDELLSTQLQVTTPTDSYLLTQGANASPTLHQGIEAGLDATLFKSATHGSLRFRQAYTYSDFRYKHDAALGKNQLPGLPKHFYQAELRYDAPSGFYVGVNAEVASKNWLDYANTQAAPSYEIFGARAGFSVPSLGLDVFLDARNITDRKYAQSVTPAYSLAQANTPTIAPGDRLSFIGGFQLKY